MRQVRYGIAMSLDGFIAPPSGDSDWIVMDPDIDFAAIYARFDTLLIGRKTYEPMAAAGDTAMPGVRSIVFSRTMQPADYPGLTIERDVVPVVRELKQTPGKDLWLFGGGELFHELHAAQLVDALDVAVIPILLGAGTLAFPASARTSLQLTSHRLYEKSGIVILEYDVVRPN